MDSRQYLKNLFRKGLEECSPYRVVRDAVQYESGMLTVGDQQIEIGDRPVYALAAGKASVPMFKALADVMGQRIDRSLLISTPDNDRPDMEVDRFIQAAHPAPDSHSLEAGEGAADLFRDAGEGALVITLISGGTSSLLCLPAEGISLEDLNKTFQLLNNSGATIREINTVRKHCSKIKGGQLLRYLNPEVTLLDLIISDVPGDDPSIIGSGPSIPDDNTFEDAFRVLQQYGLWKQVPPSVQHHIGKGRRGEAEGTVHAGEVAFARHHTLIVSSAPGLARRIGELASRDGFSVHVSRGAYNGEVEKVADTVADKVLSHKAEVSGKGKSGLFVFYGESTVDVTGEGKGGRNQELALRVALKLEGHNNITLLCAGTDGVDGPTDAAGAIVDGATTAIARNRGIHPRDYLAENDSYHFHEKMGTLLKTGPTGNNLMDLVLVLVE